MVLFALIAVVLSILALVRTRSATETSARIRALEEAVADLERKLRALTRPVPPPVAKAEPQPEPKAPPAVVAPPPPPPIISKPPAPTVPPVATKPAPPPIEPPPPPSPGIDWERWIGIRGAAVLGGVVLALAGLLFFQYSIQHGLITPSMRIVLGIGVGLFAIVASEWLRPRGYRATPEGLAGAGVVVIYAALWAGHTLYHLIPMPVSFALMVLVTATCGLLTIRHGSQLIAVLGLVGGFATPLLLSSGENRPIGLFGYVLLLDLGLLLVARKTRWPWLPLLGLAGTVLMQGLWVGLQMGPAQLALGLVVLGVFALLFTATAGWVRSADRVLSQLSQAGGLLLPFAFALYFASRADLGPHLWPVAVLMAILSAGAGWIARREAMPFLGLGASLASLAVFLMWRASPAAQTVSVWETVLIAAGLAGLFHVFVELDREPRGFDGPAPAAMIFAVGALVITLAASAAGDQVRPWPWLVLWLALAALLYRHAAFPERAVLQVVAALGVGGGLAVLHRAHDLGEPFLATALAVAVLAQVAAIVRRGDELRRVGDHAAGTVAAVVALSLIDAPIVLQAGPAVALGSAVVLTALVLLVATRRGTGGWSLAALGLSALVASSWVFDHAGLRGQPADARVALGFLLGTAVLLVVWPFLAGPALRSDRLAWYAAALAGPLAFLPAKYLWPVAVGSGSVGLLAIILAGLALAAVFGLRRTALPDAGVHKSAVVWLAAVSIGFVSVAIPLQLEKSWITIGWALFGVALLALWRRLDHPGLKWLALAHLAAVTVRLIPTEMALNAYPRGSIRILNWLLYTYLVPAAALFLGARLLAKDEVSRARAAEATLYAEGRAVGAIGAVVAGIFVVFAWLNVAVADWFAEGAHLTLRFGRSPARDLTVSIVWAIYALVLLGFGMGRASVGLRWLSLSFLVVTIGKVFLYDLGELHDLYRVVSLVGLAVSLLLVSLAYQRFVFRRSASESS